MMCSLGTSLSQVGPPEGSERPCSQSCAYPRNACLWQSEHEDYLNTIKLDADVQNENWKLICLQPN